jgi:hypothetical protein
MSEEKESKFKITDRRKFNADGTVREQEAEEATAVGGNTGVAQSGETSPSTGAVVGQAEARASEQPSPTSQSGDNVVSFPGQQPTVAPGSGPTSTAAQATERQTSQTARQKEAERAYATTSAGQKSQMPPATFLAIVNMLGIEAAMQLGMVKVPGQEEVHVDLEAARHMIDLLGALQEKTRGNLTPEEDHVMEGLLADLRMQFVSLSGRR